MGQQKHTVDSSYSWLVAFSATVVTFFQVGLVSVLGIFVPEFEDHLQISASIVGLCSSIGVGIRGIAGKLERPLLN